MNENRSASFFGGIGCDFIWIIIIIVIIFFLFGGYGGFGCCDK